MSAEFSRCAACGKIFPRSNEGQTKCPACSDEGKHEASSRDKLRMAKDLLKDTLAKGEYLTVQELAERSGVPEADIWNFIRSGEIDTVQFDDPHVREFLVNKRREQMKARARNVPEKDAVQNRPGPNPSGLHFKRGDD